MSQDNREIDFDRVLSRQGTGSRKWEQLKNVFGSDDVLPLWVADMDFPVPDAVAAHIQERAGHPIYGYNIPEDSLLEAFVHWVQRRHGWTVKKDWIIVAPGVVPSICLSVLALSEPGDGIVVQPPVYPPFFASIADNERRVVENPLVFQNGRYEIDFADLEKKLADPANKLLLFCSPHNPVGRVWSREELIRVRDLCQRYQVDVLSDEIHSDLILNGHRHTVLASLGEPAWERTVTFFAASKSFNIAGLNFSLIVVPEEQRRKKLDRWITRLHIRRGNLFGALATETAYREGEPWLEALLPYMEQNAATLVDFVNTRLSGVKVVKPEGTYLAWLDFRAHFPNGKELQDFLVHKAKVGFNAGKNFGSQGEGFARVNLATQRSVLLEALERVERALR
ncbi:MAG TPA: PatB family C-S lyase [Patescibacteria group bacterium]|nr:PatB family C-S lyase [Patescibacteria group bacterium]